MIESYYWKEDLIAHAKKLKPVKNPPRFSERLVVNFEKELIISFFLIRKLIETHKVSQKSIQYRAEIFCYKPTGKKITRLNFTAFDEIYDLKNEQKVQKSIIFITNQFIHSCTIFAFRNLKNRNWDGVYACSDYERDKTIYHIPINEIIKIFQLVGKDYPSSYNLIWDNDMDDFRVEIS
ncbi:MAG TPA: hypothetical protein VK590_11990 [Saprospiraceae bacterium]|nr:hypothetical protein [Saprospiraceae bacterium]